MPRSAVKVARLLRKNQTKAEEIFWDKVKNRRLNGYKFVRQFLVEFIQDKTKRFFVADFICRKKKLIVELDGKIHDKRKEYDKYRTNILENMGYQVIRFTNKEIIFHLESSLKKLTKTLTPSLGKEREGDCKESKGEL